MVINDNVVEHLFEEGFGDNIETDPYEVSTPENVKIICNGFISVLKDNANEKGLPIIEGKLFDALTEKYGRDKFREVLADYIEKERPEFPPNKSHIKE